MFLKPPKIEFININFIKNLIQSQIFQLNILYGILKCIKIWSKDFSPCHFIMHEISGRLQYSQTCIQILLENSFVYFLYPQWEKI